MSAVWSFLSLLACATTPSGDSAGQGTTVPLASAALRLDDALQPDLLAALEQAEARIDVVQYTLYDSGAVSPLLDALIDAADRGVAVRVLADETADGTADSLARLAAGGVDARLDDPDTTTHNKLVLVDDTAFVGSHNWSDSGLTRNHEGSVRLDGAEVTAFYRDIFEVLWQDSGPRVERTWAGGGPITPLADGAVAPALLDCIDGATERVRLALYALAYDSRYPDSDPALLVAALVAAQARGVAVTTLLDASDWITDNAINDDAIALLDDGGVTVERSAASATTHAKVLVCDDAVIVSDANWSYSSLSLYHGTSARIADAPLADQAVAWAQGLAAR